MHIINLLIKVYFIKVYCSPTRFVARAHFFRVLCFIALCLLPGLTMSLAFAVEPESVAVSAEAPPAQDPFSAQAMETRANAIQTRCLQDATCAARNALRLQQQAEALAEAKKARIQRSNGMATPLSEAQLANRKKEYDQRCEQNKKCAARQARRDTRRRDHEEAHKQRKTVTLAFNDWCSANAAACDEYNASKKKVFKGISALQPDCEQNYDQCVKNLRTLLQTEQAAWKPFCNARPSVCSAQAQVAAQVAKKRQTERSALCQAEPDSVVCDTGKRNFSTALKEASDSL